MKRLVALMICAVSLGAAAQLPDYVPADGLVAWYPFNGGANDESSFGNETTVFGASLTEDRFGMPTSAYSFDGDDHIESPHQQWLDHGDGSYTWAGWGLNSGTSGWGHLMTKGVFTSAPYSGKAIWLRIYNSIHVAVAAGQSGSGFEADGYGLQCDVDNSMNQWFHLVGVTNKNLGQISIYLNGSLVCSAELDSPDYNNNQSGGLFIGCEHPYVNLPSGPQYFVGKLDDLGIWNRALTLEEILGLYNAPAPSAGCTDSTACNFKEQAVFDDGSCLYTPQQSLESTIQLSYDNNLAVAVPEGLQSWTWSDGDNDSLKLIQPNKEYVLNGVVGSVPSLGETMAGGVIFHIDTVKGKVFLASSEPIAYDIHWGCTDLETGAVATDIGDGITNTETILAACQQANCAARVASEFGNGWFLPSRDELEAIRTRLFETGLVEYSSGNSLNWYWTSSECLTDFTDATDIRFTTGFIDECNNKNSPGGGIIAVREEPSSFCFYSDTITVEVNETVLCDSVYNPDVDLDNFIGLQDILAILSYYNASWPPWQCGDALEYQGYDYETVQIGEQCWFAENLRAEKYRNGDVIPNDLNNNQWINATEGALSVYGNGDLNLSIYGRLYNWFAATDERALCPNGWHVPADSEWTALTDGLGGDSIAGEKIKAIDGWNGTNSSGFSGLPGGNRRDSDGNFYFIEHNAFWWSTTIVNDKSVDRSLGNHTAVIRSETSPQYGHSVRCIKDTE